MKILKKIGFIIFLLIPIQVYARVNSGSNFIHEELVNDHSNLAVCSYNFNYVYKGMTNVNRFLRINIYYQFSNAQWRVSWDDKSVLNYDYSSSGANSYNDKIGNFDKVFSKSGTNIIISNDLKNQLKNNGTCPSNAWIVDSGLTYRVCFGSKTDCNADADDSSELTYNYENEIKTYFDNWAPMFKTCDELRNQNFDFKSQLELDFKKNFLYGNEYPSFISGSTVYKNGFSDLYNKYTDFKTQCDKEINEDESLSEQEKNELLDKNQQGLDKANGQVSDYEKETTSSTSYDGQYKDIANFCNESKVQDAFHFIGVMLLVVKILVPILLIIFGIVDYFKAVISSENDSLQKASKSLIIRVIAGIMIFIIPTIVNFAFGLITNYNSNNLEKCRICIFEPNNCK